MILLAKSEGFLFWREPDGEPVLLPWGSRPMVVFADGVDVTHDCFLIDSGSRVLGMMTGPCEVHANRLVTYALNPKSIELKNLPVDF